VRTHPTLVPDDPELNAALDILRYIFKKILTFYRHNYYFDRDDNGHSNDGTTIIR